MVCQRKVIFLWVLIIVTTVLSITTTVVSSQQQSEEVHDDVCDASTGSVQCESSSFCHHDTNRCTLLSTIYESPTRSITGSGKTAIAYVPNIPATTIPQTSSLTSLTTSDNMVCDTTSEYLKALPYRVATWPLSRSTIRKPTSRVSVSNNNKNNIPSTTSISVAPILQIQINLFSCHQESKQTSSSVVESSPSSSNSYWSYLFSSNEKKKTATTGNTVNSSPTSNCCCQPYHSTTEGKVEIEIWQTRPDGTYPSIRSAFKNGNTECRARYIIIPPSTSKHNNNNHTVSNPTSSSSFVFRTLAPGSTGALNGLGPNRFDIPPYGPPVIHMMIHYTSSSSSLGRTTSATRTLFIDVPILMSKTLESTKFYGSDYRGPAWITTKSSSQRRHRSSMNTNNSYEPYQITHWEPQPEKNQIRIEMDVFLPQLQIDDDDIGTSTAKTTTTKPSRMQKILCPSSYWYGFPTSFFVEPIAVCAPSLLDFFHL